MKLAFRTHFACKIIINFSAIEYEIRCICLKQRLAKIPISTTLNELTNRGENTQLFKRSTKEISSVTMITYRHQGIKQSDNIPVIYFAKKTSMIIIFIKQSDVNQM